MRGRTAVNQAEEIPDEFIILRQDFAQRIGTFRFGRKDQGINFRIHPRLDGNCYGGFKPCLPILESKPACAWRAFGCRLTVFPSIGARELRQNAPGFPGRCPVARTEICRMAEAVGLIGQALGWADIWRWHCDERIINAVGKEPTPTAATGVARMASMTRMTRFTCGSFY